MLKTSLQEFEKVVSVFRDEIDIEDESVKEVKKIIESLAGGPSLDNPSYLSWTGDLLQEAEFNLVRHGEHIAESEAVADAQYAFAKDKFKQIIDDTKGNVRVKFRNTKEKFTKDEIDEEAHKLYAEIEDKVNMYYARYKKLRAVSSSINRFHITLTHRIKELQIERTYKP